jgi:hypothetical protein
LNFHFCFFVGHDFMEALINPALYQGTASAGPQAPQNERGL